MFEFLIFNTSTKEEFNLFKIQNFDLIFTQINYSETLELSWNIEPNRIVINRISSIEANQIFQYFDVFDRTELIKMIQIHHVESFKCIKTEFGSIEPNS